MPLFLVSAICLVILLITGALGGACRATGVGAPKLCLVIAAAVGLHYLTLAIGREFMVDFGALALMLLPALLIEREGPPASGALAAALVFALLCDLVESTNSFAGAQSGLLTGVLSGACALLCAQSPRAALLAATSVPVLTRIAAAFRQTMTEGYTCLYIAGEPLLEAQLVALFMALLFIYLERARRALAD